MDMYLHSVKAVSFSQFALLIQLVATGAVSQRCQPPKEHLLTTRIQFATAVAQAVGGAASSGWMLTALTITFVVFAPPMSQAADYWGRRWPLIILILSGFIGTIVTSRAQSVSFALCSSFWGSSRVTFCTQMGVAILGEVFVGAAFATTVSLICAPFGSFDVLIPRFQPLAFAVASEVLPHRARLAGKACINAVGPLISSSKRKLT